MKPLMALQLYSIREELSHEFEKGVITIADMGYAGVETAGFPGTTPEKAGSLFRELGLEVPSAHAGLPVGEKKNEIIDSMNSIGCSRIISGFGPAEFATLDKIKGSCDRFNEAAEVAAENGMTVGIHNHWWEFGTVDGRKIYKIMLDHLVPEVFFEVDTYWVKTGGCDPAAVVRELGVRAPLLHIKDGSCERDKAMTAVGSGSMDFSGIAKAGASSVEWMIVELDRCDTDMMEAVGRSYSYLASNGLAAGRRQS